MMLGWGWGGDTVASLGVSVVKLLPDNTEDKASNFVISANLK